MAGSHLGNYASNIFVYIGVSNWLAAICQAGCENFLFKTILTKGEHQYALNHC